MTNYEWLKTLSLEELALYFANWNKFVPNCISKEKMEEWFKKEYQE